MKVQTKDLIGAALDWAVEQCERFVEDIFEPSSYWGDGGPIIERECIALDYDPEDAWLAVITREVPSGIEQIGSYGPTPLVAAMRCYVTSKLGEFVDTPEELL